MALDELNEAIEVAYGDVDETFEVSVDRETRHELAMLVAALSTDEETLVRRAIHLLYQTTVDTGKLDFHLRNEFDVTYDEYLSGMTFDEMTGQAQFQQPDDDRRYQF